MTTHLAEFPLFTSSTKCPYHLFLSFSTHTVHDLKHCTTRLLVFNLCNIKYYYFASGLHIYNINKLGLPCTFLGFLSRFRSGEASCLPFSALCPSFPHFLACLHPPFFFMRGGGHVVVVSFHPLFGWMPSAYTKWDMVAGMMSFFFTHMAFSGLSALFLNSNSDSAVTRVKRGNVLVGYNFSYPALEPF